MITFNSALRLTPVVHTAIRAPQVGATDPALSATTRPSTLVSLGQQIADSISPTYTAKGTTDEPQSQYVWERNGLDKLSMYMASAIKSSSTAARFQGLGAALLEQLAANGGQRIAQSGLAISDSTTTEPLLLGLQQARLREHATNSVTFSLTSASGATVTLGLYSSAAGLAVDADVQGGTLTQDELRGLASLADSFQSAVNGLSQEPPRLQLGALVKLDPGLFTGLQLKANLETTSGTPQTFDLQLNQDTRSLKLQGASGEVNMNFDTQGGRLLGSQAQRQVAVANYLTQFDAAQKRGEGDAQLMTLFKDAFQQLNSVDDVSNRPANHDTPLNTASRLLLSGLADFDASISQPLKKINPLRLDEVDYFDYKVSQSTTREGSAANLTVQQDQQASLKAAWHKAPNPLVELVLTLDNESQNYRYHEVDDHSRSTTRLGFVNNLLVEASATQEASQKERVRTYEKGILKSDETHRASADQSRDLLSMLDAILEQDRAARRAGAASTLDDQLQGLRHLWLLQSTPGQIAA
ncbi:hypothetical protein ACIPZF_19160 [Pseudomonas sp. NPDC089752]|uniref:hypothetical protein n=1 Tax=Pseudomonas sp. NPDC089752 TaxID=3364472 RepID=UPI00380B37F1